MGPRRRFLVALLLGGSAAIEIDGLRRALGSRELERIPPHLTLVPPTNVAAEDVGSLEALCRETARTVGPLELDLGPPATFPDHRRVVFLAVGANPELAALQRALRQGPVAERGTSERPFVAHVTLVSGPEPPPGGTPPALEVLSAYRIRVLVEELALLVQDDDRPGHPWVPHAAYRFGAARLVGPGGLEVELRAEGGEVSLLERLAIGFAGPRARSASGGAPRWCVARVDGRDVAVAGIRLLGATALLEHLAVEPVSRRLGIGTKLLDFAEHEGRTAGATTMQASLTEASDAARYLLGRGYAVTARVGGAGAATLVLTRALR